MWSYCCSETGVDVLDTWLKPERGRWTWSDGMDRHTRGYEDYRTKSKDQMLIRYSVNMCKLLYLLERAKHYQTFCEAVTCFVC